MRLPIALAVAAAAVAIPAGSLYYAGGSPESCGRCHEVRANVDTWHVSTHRSVTCKGCHGASVLDVKFHAGNVRRLMTHVKDEVPEKLRLREADVREMTGRCQGCHRQEFADWKAGAHSATYSEVFLDQEHNKKRLMMDDCLRCHGMFFQGAVRDLVTPVDTKGPWTMKAAGLVNEPAIPCLACHAMHREGAPVARKGVKPIMRPSLALWDRREGGHVSTAVMALPVMYDGERAVKMSPDTRQKLCYQCHAPLAAAQVGSGDDRTPVGVHEGLSCLACHEKHTQTARASCVNCHPRLSNCGLDVEKMDTTFANLKSKHNVHTVKCADCHPKGVPAKKPGALRAGL